MQVLDSDLLFPLIIALQPIIFELMLSSVSNEQRYGIAKKGRKGSLISCYFFMTTDLSLF